MTDDPYLDHATGILRNLIGCTTEADLSRAEGEIVAARRHQLRRNRIDGRYDLDHLQAFHRHLFGDVYPWAGHLRTIDIARTVPFARLQHVRSYLDGVLDHLAEEDHLNGHDRDAFVSRLAHYLGEVNAAHPFREGMAEPDGRSSANSPSTPAGPSSGHGSTPARRRGKRGQPDGRPTLTRAPRQHCDGTTHLNAVRPAQSWTPGPSRNDFRRSGATVGSPGSDHPHSQRSETGGADFRRDVLGHGRQLRHRPMRLREEAGHCGQRHLVRCVEGFV